MNTPNFLLDAIDVVLAWDVSDEALADAVIAQSGFMAGNNHEEINWLSLD